uniref:glycogen/starch/alpha-glucan phosphorylase n=2 Tax=Anaerotruncus TaxID=244127 RepID=UPI0026EEF14E
ALCNPELSSLITERIGGGWITNLDALEKLAPYAGDPAALDAFLRVKRQKKEQLCAFIEAREGVRLSPDFLFDVQIKRLHEYKRQLLNAFSILDIYFGLQDGRIRDFTPTAFLFGAKAAPGYYRAKAVIKFINEVARLVNSDPDMRGRMQVLFVQNYNVSYAEKLIPAADVSEQISTAGTEASGTGNMKFMLNGAVTLGTLDGANIEIVERAGIENNYIFGATVEEIAALAGRYNPRALYKSDMRIQRAVNTLIDGTLDDGHTGMFRELYAALLEGASWHAPDHYFLLHDFIPYCDARLRANRDYADRAAFAGKCLLNVAHAGSFSSDRTVAEYARDIWGCV